MIVPRNFFSQFKVYEKGNSRAKKLNGILYKMKKEDTLFGGEVEVDGVIKYDKEKTIAWAVETFDDIQWDHDPLDELGWSKQLCLVKRHENEKKSKELAIRQKDIEIQQLRTLLYRQGVDDYGLYDAPMLYKFSKEFEQKRGVYFLFDGLEVVYVGQSVNVLARISTHKSCGKIFDRFSFIPVEEKDEMDNIESAYIVKLQPKYNGHIPVKRECLDRWLEDRKKQNSDSRFKILFGKNEVETAQWPSPS